MLLAPEDNTPIKRSTPKEEDDEIMSYLPAIPYRKKGKYCNPFYRAWMPQAEGGYPGDDQVVVLVFYKQRCLKTEETKPKPVYMNFTDYKKHMFDRGLKEMPFLAIFGADYYFVEDERNYAKRIAVKTLGGGGSKPNQRKGHFEVAWHTTHADTAGYNRFIACIIAYLNKRQWTDW